MTGGTKITVDDRLTPALQRLGDAGGDLTRPMAEISEAVLEHTIDRFSRQISPDNVPWQPRRHDESHPDPGHPLLRLSGDLFNAIERASGKDFAAIGVIATGGPAIYAKVHQDGATLTPKAGRALRTPWGPRAAVSIPARPYIGLEDRDIDVTGQIVIAHLTAAAEARA